MRVMSVSEYGTKKQREKSVKEYKKDALIAARDLLYEDDVLNRIKSATSLCEIEKALRDGRHRLFV